MQFFAEFRKTAPECNPEYTLVVVEADSERDAINRAGALAQNPDWRPGWISHGEPEYWGKPECIELLELRPATPSEHDLFNRRRLSTIRRH